MSDPLTSEKVEREILRLSDQCEALASELARKCGKAAVAEADYRIAYAKALLQADGKTVGDREAQATVECEELLRDRKIAEALAEAAKERGRMLRSQLDALRSINANVRAAVFG